jgi:hypothetical protein
MADWFIAPESVTLPLSDGQSITIRKRLNAGETRAYFARMYIAGVDGRVRVNPMEVGLNTVTSYLLDWTLKDARGHVDIRGLSHETLTSVLDNLAPERFGEIRDAIEAHVDSLEAARAEEKKETPAGASVSSPTSPSPSAVTGVSSGFVN